MGRRESRSDATGSAARRSVSRLAARQLERVHEFVLRPCGAIEVYGVWHGQHSLIAVLTSSDALEGGARVASGSAAY